MKPGRELDAIVGKLVFGYDVVEMKSWARPDKHYKSGNAFIVLPMYSTNSLSALLVLNQMSERGHEIEVYRTNESAPWIVRLSKKFEGIYAELSTAICIAALRSVHN